MDNLKKEISILIPAYNESENIEELIQKIDKLFLNSQYSNLYEIILINDASNDDTEKKIKIIVSNIKNLKVINLKENVGKAYCLDLGINHSTGRIICTIDADMQYDPEDFMTMLKLIYKGSDLVNGVREKRKDNILTKFFSKIYNFILSFLFSIRLKDFFCGIKVFKREIYELMEYKGLARFVIFFSKKYKFKINEISIKHSPREKGKTSYSFFDRIILSFKDIFTLFVCIALEKKGLYQLKQIILILFFVTVLFLVSLKLFLSLSNDYIYITFLLFFLFVILNLIVNSFLKNKEKNITDLNMNIKSIIKSSD